MGRALNGPKWRFPARADSARNGKKLALGPQDVMVIPKYVDVFIRRQFQSCLAGKIFDVELGRCRPCVDGYFPGNNGLRCEPCADGCAGRGGSCQQCQPGTEPNAQRSECTVNTPFHRIVSQEGGWWHWNILSSEDSSRLTKSTPSDSCSPYDKPYAMHFFYPPGYKCILAFT